MFDQIVTIAQMIVDSFLHIWPYLLLPIGFGVLLVNLGSPDEPTAPIGDRMAPGDVIGRVTAHGGSPDHLVVDGGWLRENGVTSFHDLLSDRTVALYDDQLRIPPYGRVWLR